MTIDKWLNEDIEIKKKNSGESTPKNKTPVHNIPKEQLEELKRKKIRELTGKGKKESKKKAREAEDTFLNYVIKFKQWLNNRNYLKGDLGELETWIKNLYKKLDYEIKINQKNHGELSNKTKKELFKTIPPKLLEEKVRIAINKKLRGVELTSSDEYYFRKIKEKCRNKIKELKHYKTLQKILEQE
jgi:hypothetical protein